MQPGRQPNSLLRSVLPSPIVPCLPPLQHQAVHAGLLQPPGLQWPPQRKGAGRRRRGCVRVQLAGWGTAATSGEAQCTRTLPSVPFCHARLPAAPLSRLADHQAREAAEEPGIGAGLGAGQPWHEGEALGAAPRGCALVPAAVLFLLPLPNLLLVDLLPPLAMVPAAPPALGLTPAAEPACPALHACRWWWSLTSPRCRPWPSR